MSTDIIVRDYLKGDEDQLVPLLIKGFPFWSKLDDPAAYFKWKYLDTPRGSFLTVAAISEKIVGCDLCIQLNFKLGDVIAPGELSGDSTTDSDYRGKGIYTKSPNLRLKIIN
jgi:hypothetical protein